MKEKKKYIILGVGACAVAGMALWSSDQSEQGEEVYQISYLCRGDIPEESQKVILLGMEHAANLLNAELSVVGVGDQSDEIGQKDKLQKEIESGADAIMIESINDQKIREQIEILSTGIPVIEVNSCIMGEEDGGVIQIHPDNYALGRSLAQAILQRIHSNLDETVILLKRGTEYTDVFLRYQGVKNVLESADVSVREYVVNVGESELKKKIEDIMEKQRSGNIVAFDNKILEMTGKIKAEKQEFHELSLYGTGNTPQIINYLESGIIQVIGVTNEYSAGYLSVKSAILKLRGEQVRQNEIGYSIIDAEQIYTAENQQLLFPFVQ